MKAIKNKNYFSFSFKLSFIIYLILSNKNLFETLSIDIAHNSFLKFTFYSSLSILFFLIFYNLLSIKSFLIRITICFLLISSSFIAQTFHDISGNIININDIEIAIINLNSSNDFFIEYKDLIIKNFFIFLLGLFIVCNCQNKNIYSNKKYMTNLSILFFLFLFIFSFKRGGFGTHGLPTQLQVFIPLPFVFFTKNFEFDDTPLLKTKEYSKKNILLIIDESVGYEYFKEVLEDNTDDKSLFRNLQKFYSNHNCSAQSVFTIINGLKFKEDKLFIRENLWSLAKKNGFNTIYFSAQEKVNEYQYLQSPHELNFIDRKFFFSEYKKSERDKQILKQIKNIFIEPNNKFIVVVKNGSHFPYHQQFDLKKYNLKKQDNLRQIYKYSVKENSVEFLKRLLTFNLEYTEIIYISDHGQLISQNKLTHCNSHDPDIKEWEIPFLYFNTYDKKQKKNIQIESLYIYDLILDIMGYEVSELTKEKKKLFYGSINKRFNQNLNYKSIK